MHTNLNSTGSFWKDENNNYWSYNTQLTCYFNGYRLVNKTFYSMTTRKHQRQIESQGNDVKIVNNHYGFIKPEQDLMNYLQSLKTQLNKCKAARNSKYKQSRLFTVQQHIDLIEKVLNN